MKPKIKMVADLKLLLGSESASEGLDFKYIRDSIYWILGKFK